MSKKGKKKSDSDNLLNGITACYVKTQALN